MISELLQTSALTQEIIQYLSRERSASELEEWLVGNLQDILDSGDHKAIEIANQVDALLIEKGEQLLSEDQFRDSVYALLIEKGLPAEFNSSASGNTVIHTEPMILAPTIYFRVSHSFSQAGAGK
ncbi:hypothetical protein DNFV4_00322 [Nitrospira tepida]|uniref:Uncharacterized protein n=1 Tax=Nitrospira tepida TaxID=2973512 RepID=A0AA86T3Z8_9BACT|nr:hypothetical protein [Nitrospira tepida]CAI4029902.1 hypothetical protein DNFV4_00322 [Nitrospira tepida]